MGAFLSMQKFLATPLVAQWKFPFKVNPRFCRRRTTTFELKDNFWTHTINVNGYAVREVDSGRTLFRVMPTIEGQALNDRTKWLFDEYKIPVAHLTRIDDPNAAIYDVCLGKRQLPQPTVLTTLMIRFVPGRGDPLVCEIKDPHTGATSRIGCHGTWSQRAAILYLERGCGGRREPIAKIYRPRSHEMHYFKNQTYHVEAAIGVDIAFVLLICAAMDDASFHFHQTHRHPLLLSLGM
ncbi:hypothetical protein CCR75_009341 [Bremia lactucae]|uniref:Uncharacterized protein n=1 Tax=Bremia lactucae TaxID=4779 RepID=A0A976IEX5_BRELC|nr:hypothetical protein CCR75_009341 [Bremia lactucae]